MALIQCPECNREISDQAAACPNCGWPPAGRDMKAGESKVLGGALVAVAALGVALGLAAVSAKTNNSLPPAREAKPAAAEVEARSLPGDLERISKLTAAVAGLEAKVAELEARSPAALSPAVEEAVEEATLDSLIAANEAILETLEEDALEAKEAAEKRKKARKSQGKNGASEPAAFEAKVLRVVDGDTLIVRAAGREDVKIRLYGLGAPEGRPLGGVPATAALNPLKGRTVTVREMGADHFNRKVALVEYDGRTVNVDLAAQGRAWYSGQYCRSPSICGRIKAAESEARAARKGIWASDDPSPPWLR